MKFIRRITGKPVKIFAMALLGAASLVACGSGSYTAAPEAVPPAPAIDAFVTTVSALVAASPDDTEPGMIEAVVATAPEDTEPQPLG